MTALTTPRAISRIQTPMQATILQQIQLGCIQYSEDGADPSDSNLIDDGSYSDYNYDSYDDTDSTDSVDSTDSTDTEDYE
jgi:hypothetical protein